MSVPPQLLILDSNVWISEQMLRHGSGSAFRFFVRKTGALVALPEVVRREVTLHLSRDLHNHADAMRHSHERLLRQLGELKELVVPASEQLEAAAQSAFENTRLELVPVPLSIDSASASFEKCVLGLPPSGPKDQQFKDGVIWADAVRLAANNPVVLISADKAFYKHREYGQGLADNLAVEAQSTAYGVRLLPEIGLALNDLRVDLAIDYTALLSQFGLPEWTKIEEWVALSGHRVGDFVGGTHKIFATDDPSRCYLEFFLRFSCRHQNDEPAELVVRGDCAYRPDSVEFSDIVQRGEDLHVVGANGGRTTRRAIAMFGSAFLGHRTVRHDVRVELL